MTARPPLAMLLLAATLSWTALVGAGCGDSERGGEDAGAASDAGDAGRDGSADAGECAELGEDCSTVSCCDELRCVGVALPGMTSMQCEAE